MYVIKKINAATFKVLENDPKRNYKGRRILIFYIKIILTTFRNIFSFNGLGSNLIYTTSKKDILFFERKILTNFKDKKVKDKYLFLVKNQILKEVTFDGSYLEERYQDNEEFFFDEQVLSYILKNYLQNLYGLQLVKSCSYVMNLLNLARGLSMSTADTKVFKSLKNFNPALGIFTTLNHGDLWSGNIIKYESNYKLIDWDDMGVKSISYDLFYFFYQKSNSDYDEFLNNTEDYKERIFTFIREVLRKNDFNEFAVNYNQYVDVFILERMIKRYA